MGSDSGFAAGRVADTAETVPMRSYERLTVTGLYSIAHLLPKSNGRCGIYVLSFRNGDRYVGKALEVVVRFAAHRRTYPDDIVEVAFRRVPRGQLDAMERTEIGRLHKAGIPLRNVVHAPGRLDASDFDVLVSDEEQQRWLASPRSSNPIIDTRPDQPELRHRHQTRFNRLAADPRFADLTGVLRRYIAWTIPFPGRTELTYWSLSAVPATNAATYPRLLTLSVHTLETLFVFAPKQMPEQLTIRINVDLPTVLSTWGNLKRLTSQVPGLNACEADYDARPDVAGLEMHSVSDTIQTLELPGVVAAARRLNLDLMRKGPTMHWRTHCFDLADVALSLRHG
jgi:hypothetical protein